MVDAATNLLDDFSKVPGRIERPQTFMDIAKYPRRENVCSNFLRFFLDPNESHGLGRLVLDALAHAGGIVSADEKVGKVISVRREVPTDSGRESKFIDLLIETDVRIILIENKIDARSDNPFAEYADYLSRIAGGREEHKILLTLFRSNAGRKWGFTNLLYSSFINQLRSELGHHVTGADTKYVTLFLDFLDTLENLKKGTRMNKEFVQLLAERQEQVETFLEGIESLKAEMREKVQELGKLIRWKDYPNVEQVEPWQEQTVPYDVLPHSIRVSETLEIWVDTTIYSSGWEIWMGTEEGDNSDLKDLLHESGIFFKYHDGGIIQNDSYKRGGFAHTDSYKYKYDDDLEGIRSLLQELIDKLATSRRN